MHTFTHRSVCFQEIWFQINIKQAPKNRKIKKIKYKYHISSKEHSGVYYKFQIFDVAFNRGQRLSEGGIHYKMKSFSNEKCNEKR